MYTNLTAVQYCIQICCLVYQALHDAQVTAAAAHFLPDQCAACSADQHSHGNIMQRHNIMMQSS